MSFDKCFKFSYKKWTHMITSDHTAVRLIGFSLYNILVASNRYHIHIMI